MVEAVVIGVGNRWRGDDAAGLVVAGRIATMGLPGITTAQSDGEPTGLLGLFERFDHVVVVDAAVVTSAAGAVVRFDAATAPLPAGRLSPTTHLVGVAEAIELARRLGKLPPKIVVFGIEASHFRPGAALSPQVARAVDEAAALIVEELGARVAPDA